MKVLIYDLLCTEVWKAKLHPLLKPQLSKINSVRSYMTVSVPSVLIEKILESRLYEAHKLMKLFLPRYRSIMKSPL